MSIQMKTKQAFCLEIVSSRTLSRSSSWSHSSDTSIENAGRRLQSVFDTALCQVERTTVIVKNVPFEYVQDQLIDEIKELGFEFNFLYVPTSRKTKATLGYAFVNFVTHEVACDFIQMFSGVKFRQQQAGSTEKFADPDFAKLQGLEANVDFYGQIKSYDGKWRPYISGWRKPYTNQ